MPVTADQIEEAALALPPEERARLIEQFLDDFVDLDDDPAPADAERAWLAELRRRYARLAPSVPCDTPAQAALDRILDEWDDQAELRDSAETERAWRDELKRREARYLAGEEVPIPAEEVYAYVRARLRST